MTTRSVDDRSVATLRRLSLDQIQTARSGHIGIALGAAPIMHTLYTRFLTVDPAAPDWIGRDRFVLSAGHGSALLYAALHLGGFLDADDLRGFRQWDSRTPGHPESHRTPGVDATTGPLGQGISNAVGMAIAETMAGARLRDAEGPLVAHRTFALVSDGDLMEGVTLEATAFAGLHRLGSLIAYYDDNDVVIDSAAGEVHSADAACAALAGHGWDVSDPVDGEDVEAIDAATRAALAEGDRPSLIRVRTAIGHGLDAAGTSAAHSGPVSDDQAERLRAALDVGDPFEVPEDVRALWAGVGERGRAARLAAERRLDQSPDARARLTAWRSASAVTGGELVAAGRLGAEESGRSAGGKVLAALTARRPELVGGAADLVAATLTALDDDRYRPEARAGRIIRFGVREHAMGAIANGIALHGALRPFVSTFLVFASYEANAIRMAALQGLPVIQVLTHDSITVGEDGPTHQPIEMLAMLRAIPGLLVLRPGDPAEVAAAWAMALARTEGPTALVLSRIALAPIDRSRSVGDTERGGYLLDGSLGGADVQLVASGSEVGLAVAASALLAERGVVASVASIPSHELFLAQDAAYRDAVLDPETPRLVIEAGATLPLWRLAGRHGDVHGLDAFGASAPPAELLRRLGFTPERIADHAQELVAARAI